MQTATTETHGEKGAKVRGPVGVSLPGTTQDASFHVFWPNSMLVSLSGAAVLLGSGRALLLQAAKVAVEAQP